MTYSLHTDVAHRKRIPGFRPARPKTHTPGPQLQQRGLRYYSPELGRWVSRDPIEESGGLNLFGYVRNRPVDHIDAHGLRTVVTNVVLMSQMQLRRRWTILKISSPLALKQLNSAKLVKVSIILHWLWGHGISIS